MIITIHNSEHYKWGDNCDGWHLLKSDTLSVIQEIMPPGAEEMIHYHQKAQQLFFILEGNATFEIDGKLHGLDRYQSIHILPGVKHRIMNRTDSDLHFLVISEPKSHGDKTVVFR
jgi:mannose-6-phosphate isomerase-like protein (cupin superfamily)